MKAGLRGNSADVYEFEEINHLNSVVAHLTKTHCKGEAKDPLTCGIHRLNNGLTEHHHCCLYLSLHCICINNVTELLFMLGPSET